MYDIVFTVYSDKCIIHAMTTWPFDLLFLSLNDLGEDVLAHEDGDGAGKRGNCGS